MIDELLRLIKVGRQGDRAKGSKQERSDGLCKQSSKGKDHNGRDDNVSD